MSNEVIMIIIRALIFVILSLGSYAFVKYVKPWLQENNLISAAKIAVLAAEAMYGRYNGEQKLTAALLSLSKKGFNILASEVILAVKAAWQLLDISQIIAGIKEADLSNLEDTELNN